jgi:uncharacterized protein (TIRG00374 family)
MPIMTIRQPPRAILVGAATLLILPFVYLAVRDVDFAAFKDGLASSNYWWLIPSLAALAGAIAVRAFRWRALFHPETRPPLGPITTALLIGYLFNTILPLRAGEAARVVTLNQLSRTSPAEAIGTAIVERVYDLLVLVLLLLAALPFLPHVSWAVQAAALGAALLLAVLVFAAVHFRYGERPLRSLLRPLARVPGLTAERTDRAAANLTRGLTATARPELAALPLLLTVVSWLLIAVSFWALAIGFHLGVPFGAALLVTIATSLALLVPTPAGIGAFEAATLVALSAYGVGASEALSYAVVLHAESIFPFLLLGYVALQRHTLTLRETRSASRTDAYAAPGTAAEGPNLRERDLPRAPHS